MHPCFTEAMNTNPRVLLFALCAAGFTGWTLFLWTTLPPRLAVHFDGAGTANGWMTPGGHLATVLGVGLGIPFLILGLALATRRLPPSLLNVPNASFWRAPANYRRACDIFLDWALEMGVAVMIWMALIQDQIMRANRLPEPRIDTSSAAFLTGAFLLAILLLGMRMLLQYRRPGPPREQAGRGGEEDGCHFY